MTPEEAVALEQQVLVAAAPLERALQLATQAATVAFIRATGSADGELPFERRASLGAQVAEAFRDAAADVADALLQALQRLLGPDLPQPVVDDVLDLDRRNEYHIQEASRQAQAVPIRRLRDVQAVAARAHQAMTSTNRTVAVAVAETNAERERRKARDLGWKLVWVPERDACLACLAHAGQVADPDGVFPAATFGKWTRSSFRIVSGPPLHPNCRCQLEVIHPDEVDDPLGMPVILRREAERTVLRGTSDHASRPARLAAADRLLLEGSMLPKTVQKRARRNVQRGSFAERPIVRRPARPRRKVR